MAVFENAVDMVGFWVIIILVWFEINAGLTTMKCIDWNWYNCIANKVWGMPPRQMFAIVWTILYVLIVTSMFIFIRNVFDVSNDVGSIYIDLIGFLFVINMILNKMWTPTFFVMQETSYALIILIAVWATALAILIIFALIKFWASFVTFLFYVLWLTYAFYLNVAFLSAEKKMQDQQKVEEEIPMHTVNNSSSGILFQNTVNQRISNYKGKSAN